MNRPFDPLLAEYVQVRAARRAELAQRAATLLTAVMLLVVGGQLVAWLLTGVR